jgi:hypothetical protein
MGTASSRARLTTRRLTPKPLRPLVHKTLRPFEKSYLALAETVSEVSERITSKIQNRIPIPPANFRASIHGKLTDAQTHVRSGVEFFNLLRDAA